MSFNFNWSGFSDEFYEQAKQMLNTALNKGSKPDVVVGDIEVTELNLGAIAPELEIIDITDLAEGKFRGMLKLTYEGDAYLVLRTQVQVNPVQVKSEISIHARRGILAAHQPLVMPMLLRISNLRLRGIISLVISKHNGITLVFKNDPLQSVQVSSSFDGLGSVKDFLQSQIEDTLRNMFQEDLPKLVHSFSYKLNQLNSPSTQTVSPLSPTPTLSSSVASQYGNDNYIDSRIETASLPSVAMNSKINHSTHSDYNAFVKSPPLNNIPRQRHQSVYPGLAQRWGTPSILTATPDFEKSKYQDYFSRRIPSRSTSFPKVPPTQAYHKVGPLPLQVKSHPEQGLKSLFGP